MNRVAAICFCGRQYRGFSYHHVTKDQGAVLCCSPACIAIARQRGGQMTTTDLSVDERQAVQAASEAVGAYLERIGKTDLFAMTEAEWLGFIGHTYRCVTDEVRKMWADIPF